MENNDEHTRTHVILSEGTMVAHYQIIEKIGAGGMGEVFLAEDTKLKRQVALKFLPAHLITNEEVKSRFQREAQAVAKLNHPNIVTVHDVSEYNGRPYFVMEHVDGQPLHHFAHEEPLPVDQIIEYAIQICQGLGEAHRAGIVHRDIKAHNIVIDSSGRARLLDFGLAAVEGDDKLTKTGSTLGTVSYMSPEQVSGREIDHRSDLFSLGSVLYELISGRTPFKKDNEGATLKAIIEDIPEPLARFKSGIPVKIQEIVSKLLEKDKELRYQSAEGVIADLKRLMYDSQQSSYSRTVPTKQKKKSGLMVGFISMAVIGVIAVFAFFYLKNDSTKKGGDATPMIAVLPFENLGSPDDDYFADGITDEITSRLAGIKGLGVISRTSSMKYKDTDKNLKEIGAELGVDYILEGTVRWSKIGDQSKVKITPQLIIVSDDRHILWSDNYERTLLEVFEVQANIAAKIVSQLGLALLDKDRAELASRPTENTKAYEYYLKGLNKIRRWDREQFQTILLATAHLDTAVFLDPDFAEAHAERSKVYSWASFGVKNTEKSQIAYESAMKALELKPGLPTGHKAMGIYYNIVETDYTRALEEFNSAHSELHNDPDLLSEIALVQMRQGKFIDSKENYSKAVELDPLNPFRYWAYSGMLTFTREYEEAESSTNKAIALDPTGIMHYTQKVNLYKSMYGDKDKITSVVEDALKRCDTVELLSNLWWVYDYMPDLPWERVQNEFRKNFKNRFELHIHYSILAQGYNELGDSAKLLLYADSSRIEIEKDLVDFPDDAHKHSALGIAYAYLGDCEKAVEHGARGADILSVEECHW